MTTVKEILDSKVNGDLVCIKAKVVSKSDTETVYSRFMEKELRRCEILIANSSGAISVTLWEDLKVQFFKRKYLNAVKDMKFEICDDLSDISLESIKDVGDLKAMEKVQKSSTGKILGVEVTKLYSCINCKGRMADMPNNTVLKCSSCHLSTKIEVLSSSTTANMIIKEEEGIIIGRFYCPYGVLESLFTSLSESKGYNIAEKNVSNLATSMMEETLLNIDKLSFVVIFEDKIIKSMDIL